MSDRTYTAAALIIGNEILSGRTLDKNTQYIGEKLTKAGIHLVEVRVVPDVEEKIVDALNTLRAKVDYVFTTGGIGPTHDDITASSIAKAFDVPVIQHPEAYEMLLAYYNGKKEELTEPRLKMAQTPEGATLLPNPVSGAPGFRTDNVFTMAGVPRIMQGMLDSIIPTLKGGPEIMSETIEANFQESVLAVGLGAVQDQFPTIDIGSYPQYREGTHAVNVVLRSADATTLEQAADAVREMLATL